MTIMDYVQTFALYADRNFVCMSFCGLLRTRS